MANFPYWTRSKPRKAGWYWVRQIGDTTNGAWQIEFVRASSGAWYLRSPIRYQPWTGSGLERWSAPIAKLRARLAALEELERAAKDALPADGGSHDFETHLARMNALCEAVEALRALDASGAGGEEGR